MNLVIDEYIDDACGYRFCSTIVGRQDLPGWPE